MNNEHLNKFIDGVINSNDDDVSASAHQFALEKVKSIVAEFKSAKLNKLHESLQAVLLEYNEKTGYNIEISHSGEVIINGTVVGKVQYDMNDFDSGVSFVAADGRFSREFTTVEELTAWLGRSYGGKGK
jgi:hypothetical protein